MNFDMRSIPELICLWKAVGTFQRHVETIAMNKYATLTMRF